MLAGTDPWNVRESQSGSTGEGSRLFDGLAPFSAYTLFLYAEDTRGRHNEVSARGGGGRGSCDGNLQNSAKCQTRQ